MIRRALARANWSEALMPLTNLRHGIFLVSVHAGGGVFGSPRSVGMGVVEVAIGPGGKVELRDFNLNRERTR